MKLTESQARSAIRKWLFEANYSPEVGSYRKEYTQDNKAGTLGDGRNGEVELNTPVPIIAAPQMPNQLSVDMPPIDDPEWAPSSASEASRAAQQIASTIPDEQAEWYYGEMTKLRDKALERNKPEVADALLDQDTELKAMVKPKKAKPESMAEVRKFIRRTLLEGGFDELDPEKERGKSLGADDIDDFAQEFADEEGIALEDVYGGRDVAARRAARRKEKQEASMFELEDNEEATLRNIQQSGAFPNITTLSGIRKYIASNIHPLVEMWVTANNLSRLMASFIGSSKGLYLFFDAIGTASKGADAIFTTDQVLELKGILEVVEAIEDSMRTKGQRINKSFRHLMATNPAAFKQAVAEHGDHVIAQYGEGVVDVAGLYEDTEETKAQDRAVLRDSALYRQIMTKIVVEPIIRKWTEAKKNGEVELNRNMQGQISYEEAGHWLDHHVIAVWEAKSNGRKKKAVRQALQGLLEFRDAQEAAQQSQAQR